MASHVTQEVREDEESDPNHNLSEAGMTSDIYESEPQPFAVGEIDDVCKANPEQSPVGFNSNADEVESPSIRAENTSDENENKRQSQATLNLSEINDCFSQLLTFDDEGNVGDIQPPQQPVTAGKINTECETVPQNNGKTSNMKEQIQPSNDESETTHLPSANLGASNVSEDIPQTSVESGVLYDSESEPPYVGKTRDVGETRTQPPVSVLTTDVNETKYQLSPVWKFDVVKKVKLQLTGSVKPTDDYATETQISEASTLKGETEIKPEISTAFESEMNVCDKQKQTNLITSDVSRDLLQTLITSGVRHVSDPQSSWVGKTSDMEEAKSQPSATVITIESDVNQTEPRISATSTIQSSPIIIQPAGSGKDSYVYETEAQPSGAASTSDVDELKPEIPKDVDDNDDSEPTPQPSEAGTNSDVRDFIVQPPMDVLSTTYEGEPTPQLSGTGENSDERGLKLQPPTDIITTDKSEPTPQSSGAENASDEGQPKLQPTADVITDEREPISKLLVAKKTNDLEEPTPQPSLSENTSDEGQPKLQPSADVITDERGPISNPLVATEINDKEVPEPKTSTDARTVEADPQTSATGKASDVNELKPELSKDVISNNDSEPAPQPSEAGKTSSVREFKVQPPMDVLSTTYESEPTPQLSTAGEISDERGPKLQPPTDIITTDISEPTPQSTGAVNASDESQPELQPTADVLTDERKPISKPLVAKKTNDLEGLEPKTSTDAMTIASAANPPPSSTGNANDVRMVDKRSDPSISLPDEQRRLQQDLGCPVYIIGNAMLMSCFHMKYDLKMVNFNMVHIDKNGLLVNIPGKEDTDETNGRFQNYWGTTSTDPLRQTGLPQYLEVLTDIWIDKPFGENRLILDIGVCGQSNRDVLHSTPSRQYCYCLQVARWPGENNVGTRVGKDGKVVHHASDTLPNTVDSHTTLHYGMMYDPTRKVIVFIDVKEMKIMKALTSLDIEEPMWPLFGVYAPGFAEISMELIAGNDIDMTNEKEELILKAFL